MAKVIRSRWVYRPHGRWYRYLPRRNDSIKEFNYEMSGSLSNFKEEFAKEIALKDTTISKLWIVWLYRDLVGEPYWTKKRVAKVFGTEFVVGRMEVFPNTMALNEELWHIKHLIELRPITFPDGEPSMDDIFSVELHPDGCCHVMKHGVPPAAEQLRLIDPKTQWSPKELNTQLASKYHGCKDIFETNVYTNSKISIVR
ncbi:hypothetical protein DICVIV_05700 [Dictyocaulus viviparus]|uniref:39S ribosomal protein L30, mitochondrial n=1 Tax=Dictyocaulus viviparus TaxID=29172 RepID=A0A0D8XWL4_DICVI|nr:hypothetical protein DICVIV_05700 [Dictyocaulus viviparus]